MSDPFIAALCRELEDGGALSALTVITAYMMGEGVVWLQTDRGPRLVCLKPKWESVLLPLDGAPSGCFCAEMAVVENPMAWGTCYPAPDVDDMLTIFDILQSYVIQPREGACAEWLEAPCPIDIQAQFADWGCGKAADEFKRGAKDKPVERDCRGKCCTRSRIAD